MLAINNCKCYYLIVKRSTHSKVDASRIGLNVLTDTAYPVGRQDRHFYLRFFLFWRKVINASTNMPTATIKDATAKIVETISYAVITPPSTLRFGPC